MPLPLTPRAELLAIAGHYRARIERLGHATQRVVAAGLMTVELLAANRLEVARCEAELDRINADLSNLSNLEVSNKSRGSATT